MSGELDVATPDQLLSEQATGTLAERHAIDMDAAFTLLHAFAGNNNRAIIEVAESLIAGTITVDAIVAQQDRDRCIELRGRAKEGLAHD